MDEVLATSSATRKVIIGALYIPYQGAGNDPWANLGEPRKVCKLSSGDTVSGNTTCTDVSKTNLHSSVMYQLEPEPETTQPNGEVKEEEVVQYMIEKRYASVAVKYDQVAIFRNQPSMPREFRWKV